MSQELFSQDVFFGPSPDVLGKGMTGALNANNFNQNFVGICQVCTFFAIPWTHELKVPTAPT